MEESENRKARLRAMRMEEAETESSPNVDTSTVSVHLPNPLAEPSLEENSPLAARFGFYTDPVAAFSGNRRKAQKIHQNSQNYFSPPTSGSCGPPGNLNTTPFACHQYNQSHSSDQKMYGCSLPHDTSGSWRSPIGMASPSRQQLGTTTSWNRSGGTTGFGFPPNSPMAGGFPPSSSTVGGFPPNSPMVGGFPPNSPMVGGFPNPGFGWGGRPSPNHGRGSGYQFNNTPNTSPGLGWGGSPSPSPSPSPGRGSGYQFNNTPNHSPDFGRGGSSSSRPGRGSGYQFNNTPYLGSPNPFAGRSSRSQFNNSPSPGSGRGHVSARERPDLFYQKSMLEDPWKLLIPVVRKITVAEESSWLPKSITRKKDIVSKAVTGSRSSNLNLAEILAASYNDAVALTVSYEEAGAGNDIKNV